MPTNQYQAEVRSFIFKALAVSATVVLLIQVFDTAKALGYTHPLAVFAIGAATTIFLSLADSLNTKKISKFQWCALIINIALIIFFALMLPTNEAITALDISKVKQQNFLDVIISHF